MRPLLLAIVALPVFSAALPACASRKVLRMENQLLAQELEKAYDQLGECRSESGPRDFVTQVDLDTVQAYMVRAGFGPVERTDHDVLVTSIPDASGTFRLSAQIFERDKVLFLAISDYLRLEDATSSRAMVLLLTQLAALNYDLLLGKFQLNPRTGEITLSVELKLDDGLGYQSFEAASQHLVRTASARYPELARAAGGAEL